MTKSHRKIFSKYYKKGAYKPTQKGKHSQSTTNQSFVVSQSITPVISAAVPAPVAPAPRPLVVDINGGSYRLGTDAATAYRRVNEARYNAVSAIYTQSRLTSVVVTVVKAKSDVFPIWIGTSPTQLGSPIE